MKQIVVISGKGGTGKTVTTAALASLASNSVLADCDVDAADLHLLLQPRIRERHEFRSGFTAHTDLSRCTGCGKCLELCRFDAVNSDYSINPVACEGCAFCSFVCPEKAITMNENVCGEWFVSETRFGPMVHARLGIAEENSGKLVSRVRTKARELAETAGASWVIIDGSPGIGCPVIASLSGIDTALVVTEPTLSGLHDADRVIQVARHFGIPVMLLINKYDLNRDVTEKIERYCLDNEVACIGKVPFDKSVVNAVVQGKTVVEFCGPEIKDIYTDIWDTLKRQHEVR